jgi:hypothetical protein
MLYNWKYRILNNWNFLRFLRLALAVFVIVESWRSSEILLGILGTFVLLQTLLNAGCCSTFGCDINHTSNGEKSSDPNLERTTFTEVK